MGDLTVAHDPSGASYRATYPHFVQGGIGWRS
jgi:hypothetical protein